MTTKRPVRLKVITLGNPAVGKTCVVKQYCEKRFTYQYFPTIGIDFGIVRCSLAEEDVRLNIFDVSGESYFSEVRNEFYQDIHGAFLVYSQNDARSFDSLEYWLEEVYHALAVPAFLNTIAFVVCANKTDLGKEVSPIIGQTWALNHGFPFIEISAVSGKGIREAFELLMNSILKSLTEPKNPFSPRLQNINNLCTKEQLEAINQILFNNNDYSRMGLKPGCSKSDVIRNYRHLAMLLHPDKCKALGSEEAFKILVKARTNILQFL